MPNTKPLVAMACVCEKVLIEKDGVMARVHQFLKTDNTLGASGKPDPQHVVVDGVRYHLLKGPEIERDPSLAY
jgi:hypothetical protein